MDQRESAASLEMFREPSIIPLDMLVDPAKLVKAKSPDSWKASRLERAAVALLKSLGALTDRAQTTGRNWGGMRGQQGGKWASQSNDRFGAFDVLALLPGRKDLYLQLTTEGGVSSRKGKIEALATWLAPSKRDVEIWTPLVTRTDGNRFDLYFRRRQLRPSGDGTIAFYWNLAPWVIPVGRDVLKGAKLV